MLNYEQRQMILDVLLDSFEREFEGEELLVSLKKGESSYLTFKSRCPETIHAIVDGETVAEIIVKNLGE